MKKKILVVEDDKILQSAIEKAISEAGFDVVLASDGEEGLKKAKSEKPDLVLLDLLMPKKTGRIVLKELREDSMTKDIPVLVLTVYSSEKSIEECVALGIEGYLIKSEYTLEDVIKKINEILK